MAGSMKLSWILLLVSFGIPRIGAVKQKCGACKIVSEELQKRLDKEVPRNSLDMRHRIDKTGKRYGKVIEYSVSELRMVELLDDLCDAMDHYTWGYVMPNDGEGGTLKAGWVLKNKAGDISFEMSKSEESIRQKSLKSFCGKVIEEYEEELIEALRTGFDEDAGLGYLLCTKLAGVCEDQEAAKVSKHEEL